MNTERWQRVERLCQEALELRAEQQTAFLANACGTDKELRREVESLLAHRHRAESFIETPAMQVAARALALEQGASSESSRQIGRLIAHYRVVEKVASGGMGDVYRAVRADGTFAKEVAIKLIQGARSTDFFIARFQNERQILADLDHPNIARLLDGGTTEEGLPYVVMEYIHGMPIDEFCAKQTLSVPQRLELFRTICSAVQYAHQNLVVHRDLKPSNILVTEESVPKLLDFGIAKILNPQRGQESYEQTVTMLRLLTPDFASPEQIRNEPISTATDVYSLGVILYLLLTGRLPYRPNSNSAQEMMKVICETEPEKPSAAVGRVPPRDGSKAERSTGSATGLELERLRKTLSGDLDNIVLKALRKEPHRRYSTIEQFSEDIRRCLAGLPVLAHKDTVGYRSRKFIGRHKVGAAAAALLMLSLAGGLVATLWQARIARLERTRAERRFNDVRVLANSLIFDVHDSIKDLPGSTPARKVIVDRALQYLNSLAGESGGDISLQRELAEAYERVGEVQGHYLRSSLGDTQGSLNSYQKALQIRQQVESKSTDWNDRFALARCHRLVASMENATGARKSAQQDVQAADEISEALNNSHPNDPRILNELASDYVITALIGNRGGSGHSSLELENFRKAVAIDEILLRLSPNDLETNYRYGVDLSHVGDSLGGDDRSAALPYYQKELEIDQRLHQQSPDIRYARGVARAYGEIAENYDGSGDHRRALEYNLKDLKMQQELIQIDPKNNMLQRGLAIAYGNVAQGLSETGNNSLSQQYMQKGLEIMRGVVASSPQNSGQRHTLGEMYMASGSDFKRAHQMQSALKAFQEAYDIFKAIYDADPSNILASITPASCLEHMGEVAALAGNTKEAHDYFRQALAIVEPMVSASHPNVNALYTAADAYSGLGDLNLREARSDGKNRAKQRADWTEARSWYLKSRDVWHRIDHPSHVNPDGFDVGDPSLVERNLYTCESALAHSN